MSEYDDAKENGFFDKCAVDLNSYLMDKVFLGVQDQTKRVEYYFKAFDFDQMNQLVGLNFLIFCSKRAT